MLLHLIPEPHGRTAVYLNGERLLSSSGAACCEAARLLRDRGIPDHEHLAFYRGYTPCLSGPLSSFASLTVDESTKDGAPRFRRWRPYVKKDQT